MASIEESNIRIRKALSTEYAESEVSAIRDMLFEKLGLDRLFRLTEPQSSLSKDQLDELDEMLSELISGAPIQYVLGNVEFQGMDFKVDPSVLIPRPETEELMEIIKTKVSDPKSIIDVGTGSGIIACSLKRAFPEAKVLGIDCSEEALALAAINAHTNSCDVSFEMMDVLRADNSFAAYDVVVSNPPYIPVREKRELAKTLLDHEPALALFSEEPLEFYRVIAMKSLKARHVFFECHSLYAYQVKFLMLAIGYEQSEVIMDSCGLPRFVHAQQ